MPENSPLTLLTEIRQQALDLVSQGVSYARQSAAVKNIAYVVNDLHFYCEATDIREVSICENLVLVPQTKKWMRGLVNSKGVLYSVCDLSLFAGFNRPIQTKKAHLLLLNDVESQSALLVNRVVGFRYFDELQRLHSLEGKQDLLDGLGPFVNSGYHAEGRDWFGLDVRRLLAAEQFREIQ